MATPKPKPPVITGTPADPTALDALVRRAMQDMRARLQRIKRGYIAAIDAFKPSFTINARYSYDLNAALLQSVLQGLDTLVDSELLEGGQNQLWFFENYVQPAYERGTAQQYMNLSRQSPTYSAVRESLAALVRSEPYQRRLLLVRAREFEEMKGLSGQVKADMSRVLTDGLARGLGPRDVAANLTQQIGIEEPRAHRIARTEIPTALRRARMDEADEAREEMGLRTKEMHISALSTTTRVTHAQRHGKLFTTDQQREWWSQAANSINCYVPGTRVQGRFLAGSKAFYRGPVIKMVTASGRNLTVTPNHPVMTARGLQPAVSLRKGDYALAYGAQIENSVRVSALDDQQVHARIEDVFASLVQVGHSFTRGVGAVDFHGDAAMMDVEVQVVRAERLLTTDNESAISQCLDGLKLVFPDAGVSHGASAGRERSGAVDLSAACSVGGSGEGFSLLGGTVGGAVERPRASVPLRQSMIAQDAVDGGAGDTKGKRQGLHALPGGVFADEIVLVDVLQFRGHVYDLQEASGLMVANGIIASNCKCTTVSVMVDASGEPVLPYAVENARETFKRRAKMEDMPWAKDL